MNGLAKTLFIASALCLLSGMATAKEVKINCTTTKCVHQEEMGKSQTDQFLGQCNGGIPSGMSMVCHPVKGMTCTKGQEMSENWSCLCTNDSVTKKQTATIDVLCPS